MKVRKGSMSYWLLSALEIAAEGAVYLGEFSYSAQYRAIIGMPEAPGKKALVEAIRRLKNKGVIEYEIVKEGEVVLRLTSLGREFLGDKAEDVWDGKYRIVIWDIPENKRRIRNLFRRRIKEWGFIIWQRSVWVSKRNVTEKLRKLITDLELGDWVAILESDDSTLHTLFNDRRS